MDPKDQILARMYGVLTVLSLLPVLVVGQIGWVMLTESDTLRDRGETQARSSVEIPAMRGAILDREGRALAMNTARYNLALDPTVEGFRDQQQTFFDSLATLTDASAATYRQRVNDRSSPQYVELARQLTEEQAEAIRAWDVPGVILTPRFDRQYNYGSTAAHMLGHVDSDGHGIAGLEMQYDEHLSGTPGRRAVKRDRLGRIEVFVGGSVVEPEHGENIALTIDLVRQSMLEEELERAVKASGASWGAALALEPETGAILGMASAPTYDPNHPGLYTSPERRNRALADRMEPGSTFKPVTAAAALEQGLVSLDDSIDTGDGWAVFHGRSMRDVAAYGTISFADVLAKSSNVGVAKTAQQMEPGTLYQYARNLGFGQPTWVDLPGEIGGSLRRTSEWSGTTLTSMSIGYEVEVTPLQMAAAYAAIANGGTLMQPYVVQERRDMTGETLWTQEPTTIRRALDEETTKRLTEALQRTVTDGTGTAAQGGMLPVAGKTGTALKAVGGSYDEDASRGSFAGFFPADDPEVALVVVLDEPDTRQAGGRVAAPLFQRIAQRWVGTFPETRRQMAEHHGAREDDSEAASATAASSRADRLDGAGDAMPDLEGLSTREAVHWLRSRGAAVDLDGRGTVVDQWPAAGEPVPDHVRLVADH